MRRYYLNLRVMLVTFVFGLASVGFFQSFSNSGIFKSAPVSAVIIVPVVEKETRSRLMENYDDSSRCGGWPVFDYDTESKKKNRRRLKKKSSNKRFKKIIQAKNFPG